MCFVQVSRIPLFGFKRQRPLIFRVLYNLLKEDLKRCAANIKTEQPVAKVLLCNKLW